MPPLAGWKATDNTNGGGRNDPIPDKGTGNAEVNRDRTISLTRLERPVEEGGLGLMDLTTTRPTWAFITDAIINTPLEAQEHATPKVIR